MPDRLLGILGHQTLEFSLGLLMFEMSRPCLRKDRGELAPRIGRVHIDNTDGLDLRLWRIDAKQLWWLTVLDTAPELPFLRHDKMLIERIGMSQNLDPLPSPGDNREHRGPRRYHPHIVLQLRHVFR